jgi:hypothetical protein
MTGASYVTVTGEEGDAAIGMPPQEMTQRKSESAVMVPEAGIYVAFVAPGIDVQLF